MENRQFEIISWVSGSSMILFSINNDTSWRLVIVFGILFYCQAVRENLAAENI